MLNASVEREGEFRHPAQPDAPADLPA